MDDRGYIAQALFDRLRGGEVEFRVLGDTRGYPDTAGAEIDLAVHPDALRSMPRAVARFCHEFDLQLVQLLREAHGWHFVAEAGHRPRDRKSTRLNFSHRCISYAVFCLKKKARSVGSSSHSQ